MDETMELEILVAQRTAALSRAVQELESEVAERKSVEEKLAHINRLYRVLSAVNHLIVRCNDRPSLFQEACRIVVEQGLFRMAWIGLIDGDDPLVRPAAHWGLDEGYLEDIRVSAEDVPEGRGPMGQTLRGGVHFICNDVEHEEWVAPWRAEALTRGYRSIGSFPLGPPQTIGALTVYSSEAGFFDSDEIALLDELAGDISFALEAMERDAGREHAEQQLRQGLERFRAAMEGTIQAMAMLTEMRDPYTAGHQRRVSKLASGIASEMGLSADEIEGVRMAGTIHDLGKVSVPTEILSKPGRISEIEFSIIKTHAQVGYEAIKAVDFPWPVARIVLQHHERMNGSGYPSHLCGEEILLSARIVAVADVVEAMTAYRPYRSALGIDAALREIARGRGSLYDVAAADACLRLFEGGFHFD